MRQTFSNAVFLLCATASALQIPFLESLNPQNAVTTKKPLVSSEAIQADISSKALLKRAKELFKIAELGIDEYNHPTRVIGSKGHLATLDYIYSTLASLGDYYTITNQTFPAVVGNTFEYRLVLGDASPNSTQAMSLTPPTTDKEPVFGPLVLVANDGCAASDYPSNTTGAIALIQRGTCPFGTKSENAGKAGALAAVVYNTADGSLSGTLGTPSPHHVATFGISKADAAPYIAALKNGTIIESSAYIDAIVESIGTTNIIAQTTAGDASNCVMLGGHSDSVAEGPGINDDGSGSLTLLEIATQLTKYEVRNCVRFAWWAGEEEGLLGSDYYVSQLSAAENKKIRLFMDYDMLASPNYAYQVYNATNALNPVGSEELRDLYVDWYKKEGLNYTFIAFDGRSDYDGFIRHGIPGGGIATGAEGVKTRKEAEMFGGREGEWFDPCYHQLCDGVSNCDLEAWEVNARLVAHSVATYAVSFEGFPERRVGVEAGRVAETPLYHGSKLVM
ncbi:putative aminopeptidase [Lophium mytilinum]|uniref:Peptide hydrolase n=1 Tax=Lophium mytilinum TaxID=390894 RepID=A0A6A6R7G0_9PEZI|nr:putative aminopeptidase [Lophium mytilinum]